MEEPGLGIVGIGGQDGRPDQRQRGIAAGLGVPDAPGVVRGPLAGAEDALVVRTVQRTGDHCDDHASGSLEHLTAADGVSPWARERRRFGRVNSRFGGHGTAQSRGAGPANVALDRLRGVIKRRYGAACRSLYTDP